jgi:hypothetical protein
MFQEVRGRGGGCQFMVTICFASIFVEIDASLHLASSNLNSLDGNSSMKSTERSWKSLLTSRMMCHVDKMSCQNAVAFLH